MSIKATDVANWFIAKSADDGDVITHLKLQKLLYYSEAWHQALSGADLLDENFQAWAHGPVVPEVFQEFKHYGWNPLPIPEKNQVPRIEKKYENVLKQVYEVYGDLPAKTLEDMTHQDKPWIEARAGCAPEDRCENIMPKEDIKSFYKKKYSV